MRRDKLNKLRQLVDFSKLKELRIKEFGVNTHGENAFILQPSSKPAFVSNRNSSKLDFVDKDKKHGGNSPINLHRRVAKREALASANDPEQEEEVHLYLPA